MEAGLAQQRYVAPLGTYRQLAGGALSTHTHPGQKSATPGREAARKTPSTGLWHSYQGDLATSRPYGTPK